MHRLFALVCTVPLLIAVTAFASVPFTVSCQRQALKVEIPARVDLGYAAPGDTVTGTFVIRNIGGQGCAPLTDWVSDLNRPHWTVIEGLGQYTLENYETTGQEHRVMVRYVAPFGDECAGPDSVIVETGE